MENSSNVTDVIIETINTIFENLFSSIDNSLYSVLDDITFVSSDIMYSKNFENIFGTSISNGILLIANSLLLGFLLYYAVKYLISHFTYSRTDSPASFIFKLLLCSIGMNFSFFIMEQVLDLNSYLSLAIRNLGEVLFNKNICFSELINSINSSVSTGQSSLNIFSLDGLLKGSLTLSLLNLVFSYSLRYIMIKIFVLFSPFAILSLSMSSSSWFFKSWAKNLFSLLLIQTIVSLVLLILFSMDYSSSDLFSKFVYIGGIYALIKANSFVREFIGGVSTDVPQTVHNLLANK
jgi:hypothetical protein